MWGCHQKVHIYISKTVKLQNICFLILEIVQISKPFDSVNHFKLLSVVNSDVEMNS